MLKFLVLVLAFTAVALAQQTSSDYEKKPCSEPFYNREGKCGLPEHGYFRCQTGFYCSQFGYCGKSKEYQHNAVCKKETRKDEDPKLYRLAPNDDQLNDYAVNECTSSDCISNEYPSSDDYTSDDATAYVPQDDYYKKEKNLWQKFWENCFGWLYNKKYENATYPKANEYQEPEELNYPVEEPYQAEKNSYKSGKPESRLNY